MAISHRLAVGLAFGATVAACAALAEEQYPSGPIRIVVGSPPGGSTDTFARLLAQKLSVQMSASLVVENRPGANANIGNELVARATPNGQTLLFNTAGIVLSPALGEPVNFNFQKDLAPVGLVATVPLVLTVTPSLPVDTAPEFITHVRQNPGKLTYGSAGVGNITHLGNLMFLEANGASAVHVPYKGAAPALLDVIAGRVQFSMSTMVSSAPLVKSKRLKGLAVTSLKRSDTLPDVPTLNEAAMPGFEVGAWYGVMAPAKTPPAIVKKLNSEIVRALRDPDSVSRLNQEGGQPLTSSADEYKRFLGSELQRWSKLIKGRSLAGL
jgi:tripartite-type tricarboxylate transporter receptor subunit TctC